MPPRKREEKMSQIPSLTFFYQTGAQENASEPLRTTRARRRLPDDRATGNNKKSAAFAREESAKAKGDEDVNDADSSKELSGHEPTPTKHSRKRASVSKPAGNNEMTRPANKKRGVDKTLEPSKKQADTEEMTADFHKTDDKELPAAPKEKKMENTPIKRGSAKKATAIAEPGNPEKPSSFVNFFDSSEQGLAAYLGFDTVSDLRTLALSWPVLGMFFKFRRICDNLNKATALRKYWQMGLHSYPGGWHQT